MVRLLAHPAAGTICQPRTVSKQSFLSDVTFFVCFRFFGVSSLSCSALGSGCLLLTNPSQCQGWLVAHAGGDAWKLMCSKLLVFAVRESRCSWRASGSFAVGQAQQLLLALFPVGVGRQGWVMVGLDDCEGLFQPQWFDDPGLLCSLVLQGRYHKCHLWGISIVSSDLCGSTDHLGPPGLLLSQQSFAFATNKKITFPSRTKLS